MTVFNFNSEDGETQDTARKLGQSHAFSVPLKQLDSSERIIKRKNKSNVATLSHE